MNPNIKLWGHNSDTNMAIYTHVSSNYTHIYPIIGHIRGSYDLTYRGLPPAPLSCRGLSAHLGPLLLEGGVLDIRGA